MKTRTALSLALFSVVGMFPLAGVAQDQQPASRFERRLERPSPNPTNLPTSPILPMTNPVAPMTNPVQPFVRYQGPEGRPTVVVPPSKTEDSGSDRRRGRRDDRDVIVVGPYLPYYDPYFYQPVYQPAPIPGQLPGTFPLLPSAAPAFNEAQPVVDDTPRLAAPVTASPAISATTFVPEPNIIITPQPEPLVVERPPLGISRVDTVAKYGEPWGSITMRGRETVFFRGGLVVVFENSRAVEVR